MKLITFPYYLKFRCKASKCTDSCCKGWEVRIDPCTAQKYRSLASPIGDRVRAALCESEDGDVFRMVDDRCPFLNESGLCDIITECGEDMISDICKRHPRYFTILSDIAYGGLGMSCEEAARLILTEDVREYTECEIGITDGENYDVELRDAVISARDEAIKAISETPSIYAALSSVLSLISGVDDVIYGTDFSENTTRGGVFPPLCGCIEVLVEFLSELEYMSDELMDRLRAVASRVDYEALAIGGEAYVYLTRVLRYLIDRYFTPVILDADTQGASAVIALSFAAVVLLYLSETELTLDAAIGLSKLFSSEIEYSPDNLDTLRDADGEIINAALGVVKHLLG